MIKRGRCKQMVHAFTCVYVCERLRASQFSKRRQKLKRPHSGAEPFKLTPGFTRNSHKHTLQNKHERERAHTHPHIRTKYAFTPTEELKLPSPKPHGCLFNVQMTLFQGNYRCLKAFLLSFLQIVAMLHQLCFNVKLKCLFIKKKQILHI